MKFNFEKGKELVKNQLHVYIKYQGGDADIDMESQKKVRLNKQPNEPKDLDELLLVHKEQMEQLVEQYELLGEICSTSDWDYDSVLGEYGYEMVSLWENVPQDIIYGGKCYLERVYFIYYDNTGQSWKHRIY